MSSVGTINWQRVVIMILPDIESYIEFLYQTATYIVPWSKPKYGPKLELPAYEEQFIQDVYRSRVLNKEPFTDKQAEFALKLIKKYESQLKLRGIEQPVHANFINGIKVVDRSNYLRFDGEFIRLKVTKKYSDEIKQKSKEMIGGIQWDMDAFAWRMALTEPIVDWVVSFAMSKYIPIDEELLDIYNKIQTVKKTPYAIELSYNGTINIMNAPQSMLEYIDQHIGFDDLVKLVDYAPILEYTVSEEITDMMINEFTHDVVQLCLNRRIILSRAYELHNIITYAKTVNRFPIVVYNVGISTLYKYEQYFTKDEILVLTSENVSEVTELPEVKLIYSNVVVDFDMPLLISNAIFRSPKVRKFENNAEKIIYLVK